MLYAPQGFEVCAGFKQVSVRDNNVQCLEHDSWISTIIQLLKYITDDLYYHKGCVVKTLVCKTVP